MFIGQPATPASVILRQAAEAEQLGAPERARALLCEAVGQDETPESRFTWAMYLSDHGEEQAALTEWRRLWEAIQGTEYAGLAWRVGSNLAALHRRRQEWQASRTWHQRSVRAAMRLSARESRATVRELCRDAAEDALAAGRPRLAERYLASAFAGLEGSESDSAEVADFRGLYGMIQLFRGESVASIANFRRALRLHRRHGDDQAATVDALNLSAALVACRRPVAAWRVARLARRHAARSGIADLAQKADVTAETLRRAVARLRCSPEIN